MEELRLPRKLADEPDAEGLAQEIMNRVRPLRSNSDVLAVPSAFTPNLEAVLRSALLTGRVARGIEEAEKSLATEEVGLRRVDERTGVTRGKRISRLLVLADDGEEPFYREVEKLVRRYAPRVLPVRLAIDGLGLGQPLFGQRQIERALLLEHKDAVSELLLALAADWREAAPS